MRYLLDTCVVSELQKPQPHPHVVNAFRGLRIRDTHLSVITIGELRKGASLLPLGSRKRTELERWLAGLEQQFAGNVLSVDLETSHIWGEIAARAQRQGATLSASDGLIAASAIRHGLHVMTRNVHHFEPTGVLVMNPWMDTQG